MNPTRYSCTIIAAESRTENGAWIRPITLHLVADSPQQALDDASQIIPADQLGDRHLYLLEVNELLENRPR